MKNATLRLYAEVIYKCDYISQLTPLAWELLADKAITTYDSMTPAERDGRTKAAYLIALRNEHACNVSDSIVSDYSIAEDPAVIRYERIRSYYGY